MTSGAFIYKKRPSCQFQQGYVKTCLKAAYKNDFSKFALIEYTVPNDRCQGNSFNEWNDMFLHSE